MAKKKLRRLIPIKVKLKSEGYVGNETEKQIKIRDELIKKLKENVDSLKVANEKLKKEIK